jgi:hypothetical protein
VVRTVTDRAQKDDEQRHGTARDPGADDLDEAVISAVVIRERRQQADKITSVHAPL